ncbi:FtsX-like permease family protein [Xylanimonas ulmi]|uniref:FtsX-like permease family protein n=1 Tax=Xylanimonas ulmi TaxID=228973 RepID=A0A4Q7M4X1_9MICO|nr:FtsX-like permease family protein [Xylanibacterium ulmi]RZS61987.1 FtsX-like permease family protein [Xylanibacterium ulmi]
MSAATTTAPLALSLRTTLALARLFARRRDGDRLAAALPLASFALVTALLLVVLGGAQAFFRMDGPNAGGYVALAVIALSLLVAPLLTLGAAAARLSARRRDDRLSSLRLLGATRRTVTALTVIEAASVALAGAVAGTVVYAGLAPLVGLLRFAGEPLGAQMWLPWFWLPAVWLGVALVAAGSAAIGLRGVVVTPLGVRTRQRPGTARGRRAIVAAVVVLGAACTTTGLGTLGEYGGFAAVVAGIAGAFACGLLALDAVGPWYVRVRARRLHRHARDVPRLLAARIVLEDPKAAWRQVAGISVTTFVGVVAGAGLALAQGSASSREDAWLLADIRTGVVVTLVVSFLMAACTVAINQAAATLDRARVAVSLDRLGVPRTLLAQAARRSVMSVLWTVVVGSAAVSAVLLLPIVGAAVLTQPLAVAVMVAVFAAGFALVRAGASVAARLTPGILARPERAL